MGRKRVLDTCFLCDSNPCVCNLKKKVISVKQIKEKAQSIIQQKPKPITLERLASKAKKEVPVPEPPAIEDNTVLEDAIRALEPILHFEERQKYSYLFKNDSLDERMERWKKDFSSV